MTPKLANGYKGIGQRQPNRTAKIRHGGWNKMPRLLLIDLNNENDLQCLSIKTLQIVIPVFLRETSQAGDWPVRLLFLEAMA